jgi:hypothetical protein
MHIKGLVSTLTAKGDGKFSAEQLELIKKAKPGAKLFFENIKIAGYDGTQRMIGAMLLILK